MKRRAAASQPLEVATGDLDGLLDGVVLPDIESSAVRRTDEFTRPGADPEGAFPAFFGHEGAAAGFAQRWRCRLQFRASGQCRADTPGAGMPPSRPRPPLD